MKSTLTLLLSCITWVGYAQKFERYYDYNWKPSESNSARFFAIVQKKDSVWERNDYFLHERSLQMHGFYKDDSCTIAHGKFEFYHPNKTMQSTGINSKGKKEGLWLRFHPNGMLADSSVYFNGKKAGTTMGWYANGYPKDSAVWAADGSSVYVSWFDNGLLSAAGRYTTGAKMNGTWNFFHNNGKISAKEQYSNGELLNKQYFDEQGNAMADTANRSAGAAFKGGSAGWQKYMYKQIHFPDRYRLVNADKAVVVVDIEINEDGTMGEVNVSTPLHPDFDKIAYSAIRRSPQWQPAISHNRRVKDFLRQVVAFSQE